MHYATRNIFRVKMSRIWAHENGNKKGKKGERLKNEKPRYGFLRTFIVITSLQHDEDVSMKMRVGSSRRQKPRLFVSRYYIRNTERTS